jgi:tetratricopeptide (TPR) repeat protein
MAEEASGAYLAARQARYDHDFTAAAEYFTRALTEDQSNPAIMENAVVAHVALGNFDRALPIARKIEADELRSQVAHMVLVAEDVLQEDYDAVLTRLEAGNGVGQLADGLIAAWAHLGQGDMSQALDLFDEVAEERGLQSFAIYQKALALASVGDFEGADKIFAGESDGPMQGTRRGVLAWAEVLSQLGRNEEAVAQIDETFGTDLDPEIQQLRDRLEAGDKVPFTMISGAADGVAEVFFSLGRALLSDTSEDYVLLYSRVAEHLSPDHIDAVITSAELLESLGRYELATAAYKRVPREHPEVLEQLAETHPDQPTVHVSAGDLFRQLERFDEAAKAYDKAIALYEAREADQWFVHYARAISYERQGMWDKAEADFRRALELNPEQPQVLNYLGYSLVEKQSKLDEALDMIERAVEARPESGYIVDSLGWVLYRLGRYDEAIGHMERAAELMPVDPVVNDHLGDVLWAVGRETEARFQWKRALSFIDDDTPLQDIDPDRIRRKLEVGLDQVLEEEGAPPLKVADDGE